MPWGDARSLPCLCVFIKSYGRRKATARPPCDIKHILRPPQVDLVATMRWPYDALNIVGRLCSHPTAAVRYLGTQEGVKTIGHPPTIASHRRTTKRWTCDVTKLRWSQDALAAATGETCGSYSNLSYELVGSQGALVAASRPTCGSCSNRCYELVVVSRRPCGGHTATLWLLQPSWGCCFVAVGARHVLLVVTLRNLISSMERLPRGRRNICDNLQTARRYDF